MSAALPVVVLTGFLGSGKTTLLNSLLKDPLLANACVVINEFGAVGIDHLLVESSTENIVELASGCLCCTIRGDLIDTLTDLLARRAAGTLKAFDRIVIETTGLADPAPILHVLMREAALVAQLRLEGVITVVDAVNGDETLDAHAEAVKQVAVADRIVLTKLDLLEGRAGEDRLFAITTRMRRLNPTARLLTTFRGEATAARLFTMGFYDAEGKGVEVRRWLNEEALAKPQRHHHDVSRHDAHIRSFAVREARAISPRALEMFLELLTSYHGPRLLRLKGIVKLSDDPQRPVIVQGAQHVLHPPLRLARWPDVDHDSRLVVIGKDMAAAEIDGLFRAFTDQTSEQAAAHLDQTLSLRKE